MSEPKQDELALEMAMEFWETVRGSSSAWRQLHPDTQAYYVRKAADWVPFVASRIAQARLAEAEEWTQNYGDHAWRWERLEELRQLAEHVRDSKKI